MSTEPTYEFHERRRGTVSVTRADDGWHIVGVASDRLLPDGRRPVFRMRVPFCDCTMRVCPSLHKTDRGWTHDRNHCHRNGHPERFRKMVATILDTYGEAA